MNQDIITKCRILLQAYKNNQLGYMKMPEDEHPDFGNKELRLVYFTLPMALNYQRNSYTLRENAKKAYQDPQTKDIFNLQKVKDMEDALLREKLIKHKVALQPNKHIQTWKTIATTIVTHRGSLENLFKATAYDFLELKKYIQNIYKSDFPYLSGPKIFNYRAFVIQTYGGIILKNSDFIEIAPDTHVTQCSVKLGVITEQEAETLSKEEISKRWRDILQGTGINPIDMHSPLWFWSRNNFIFTL